MNKKHLTLIVLISFLSVMVWLIGEILLVLVIQNEQLWVSRAWLIIVFIAAAGICLYCCSEEERQERKEKRKQDNDNYKGIC